MDITNTNLVMAIGLGIQCNYWTIICTLIVMNIIDRFVYVPVLNQTFFAKPMALGQLQKYSGILQSIIQIHCAILHNLGKFHCLAISLYMANYTFSLDTSFLWSVNL